MRSGTIGNLSIIKKMLFFKLPSNFQTRPLSAPLWPLLLKTPTGLHWSWLSFPRCYGHTYRRLLNAVVVVVEERNTFRCVICPSGAAVVVPVRGKKGLLWLVHTVLISGPLPQTIWASSTCRQVAHDCIVNWIQQQQQQQRVSVKTLKMFLIGVLFLTSVSPGAEGTLSAPGISIQTATLSVCCSDSQQRLCTNVVLVQTPPADVHVHIMIRLNSF